MLTISIPMLSLCYPIFDFSIFYFPTRTELSRRGYHADQVRLSGPGGGEHHCTKLAIYPCNTMCASHSNEIHRDVDSNKDTKNDPRNKSLSTWYKVASPPGMQEIPTILVST